MSVCFAILIYLSILNYVNFGVVWGFGQSQMLIGLVIGESGDEANTS